MAEDNITFERVGFGLIYTPNIPCSDISDYLQKSQKDPKELGASSFGIMCSPPCVRYSIDGLRVESSGYQEYLMPYALSASVNEFLPVYQAKTIDTYHVVLKLSDGKDEMIAKFSPTERNMEGVHAFEAKIGDIVDIQIVGRSEPIELEKIVISTRH